MEITLIVLAPSAYFLLVVFAKFDEIPSMILQDIKETIMMFIIHYAPNRCLCIKVANSIDHWVDVNGEVKLL